MVADYTHNNTVTGVQKATYPVVLQDRVTAGMVPGVACAPCATCQADLAKNKKYDPP